MGSPNIRDILTCFSPSLDFLAVSSGDGRIKIWDTVKRQLQTEFTDIASTNESDLFGNTEKKGHLSLDYTCMKWVAPKLKPKKRKLGTPLLVLGTGSGDVLALEVSSGQLRWKISDCHPGGVSSLSFSSQHSHIYTSGADGIVCEIDFNTGNLVRKFKASRRAISSMSVSSDGKIIATASAQIKIIDGSDHKKIQKFYGHPGPVRCMVMSDDGKYVFSSAVGERYVAVWEVGGSKKQSASCVLAMDHPSIYLDCMFVNNGKADEAGFYILAISEMGICYYWNGKDIEELRAAKPTKISLSVDENLMKSHKGTSPAIFAAKIRNAAKHASASVFVAYGVLVKPSFEKIVVHRSKDVKLNFFLDGVLLPLSQAQKSKKLVVQRGATALDRANAEGAMLPIPKIVDTHGRIAEDRTSKVNNDQEEFLKSKDDMDITGTDTAACCMEDRLKSLGILGHQDNFGSEPILNSTILDSVSLEIAVPQKKMRAAILSMTPADAFKLLKLLIATWQSRSHAGKYVLSWIYSVLVHHGHQITSLEPENAALDSLYKMVKSKGLATQSLLQLSGRLQLVTMQIDKAARLSTQTPRSDHELVEGEGEDEDEDVDEVLFGEEDSESGTSNDDNDE